MADESTQSIEVDAPPADVMAVIADFPAYPEWATAGLCVDWHLVKGQMQKAQKGQYLLTPEAGRTRVTYTLSVQLAVPMIGLFRRKAEKMIMDIALKELKRRVEAAE